MRLELIQDADSCDFSDRILDFRICECYHVGRADLHNRSEFDNAFFNCKVLSKKHAKILCKGNTVTIQDLGSSNGTFVNNSRLSKSGKPSRSREIYNGDIIQFGSFVTEIRPVIARVTVAVVPGNSGQNRNAKRKSVAFTPADSTEDVTVASSDESENEKNDEDCFEDTEEQCLMSKESIMMLKEKLLEMERGMEFLSVKEKDYEELQMLAEEEAETICNLEKENYKLKMMMAGIENRINDEKQKYIKLAEIEAETICNLEKENYKLSDLLSRVEKQLEQEREKFKSLDNTSSAMKKEIDTKLVQELQNQTSENKKEILNLQNSLVASQRQIKNLQEENEKLKLQEYLLEATESDHDLILEKKMKQEQEDIYSKNSRHSIVEIFMIFFISFISYIIGYLM